MPILLCGNADLTRLDWRIAKTSDSPLIPNFEILGRIGGGAYGEVYLARSVTGMYRAVKVVRREDFEYEKTFEREFEGIQRYEKVSHDHAGLIDVLHVGRNNQDGFYYYVMELADDEEGGHREVDVDAYKSRTLSSDLRRKPTRSVRECVDLGMAMAGALGHLHHAGLTHRDVKPSNIIFVKGQPKLADVGLVASTGQRTFVGTEGYVPPEGPGTISADLYSLAMVLYEMHTGKDRLEFPELPTNLEILPTVNRDEWRSLNGVICRAGAPDPRKRFESAHGFARALQAVCGDLNPVAAKKRRPLAAVLGIFVVLSLLAAVVYGGYWLWHDKQSFIVKHSTNRVEQDDLPKEGEGVRPTGGPVAAIGEGNKGDKATDETGKSDGKEKEFSLIESPQKSSENSGEIVIRDEVISIKKTAKPGELTETVVEADKTTPLTVPTLIADPLENQILEGQVKIVSQPSAATVYYKGAEIGITETKLLNFEVGPIELVFKALGYHDYVYKGKVKEGTQIITGTLLPDLGPIPGNPWINSLGMEFLPGSGESYVSKGEVTVEVFDQFLKETGKQIPTVALSGIVQVPEDRALWEFCDWMAEKDRQTGHFGPKRYYRPQRNLGDARKNSFYCSIENDLGTLVLNTEPPGAKVYRGGIYFGETPLVSNDFRLGSFELELYKPGYQVGIAKGDLSTTEVPQDFVVTLEQDASVVFGARWTNTQGMELAPFENLLVAVYETPTRAYREFVLEMGSVSVPTRQEGGIFNHPASGVSLGEASAFCEWLTLRERAVSLIRPWQRYRLPSDLEWSRMAGLKAEEGATPEARNHSAELRYPWGGQWPPPPGVGNFADIAATVFFGKNIITGYTDGFERTSPIGSFAAAESGIFDLSGNVWEWVLDPYTDGSDGLQVVRGGGWNSSEREVLATAYRNPVAAEAKEDFYGFRYVLEDLAQTHDSSEDAASD